MAGVTFLALGNGSPDLFSTFAAMRVGSGSLAIGELIGAAFFITSVVAGSMAIVNPFKVSRKSFLRDVCFFSGAVGVSVGLLAGGKITIWETTGMIAYYIIYVVVVVMVTLYWGKRSKRRRSESRARHHYQHPDEEVVEVEDDEPTTAQENTALIGNIRDLENVADEEDDTEMEQRYADLQHRMSLIRPNIDGSRMLSHHNHSHIRPSLFGALEVLSRFALLMKFRSLSAKLASASALPHRHDRRHSLAQPGMRSSHGRQRNLSDPFSQFRSAPPQHAPWHTSEGQSHSPAGADYFNYPTAPSIRRAVSPMTIASIPEDAVDEQSPDSKSTPFLRPPEQRYGSRKLSDAPSLHLDTSDRILVSSPGSLSRDGSAPSSPLGFRDVQESGSLNYLVSPRTYKWWPSFLLPQPQFLYVTLFPTLIGFQSKPWFHKILSIIAIPAVFCLTITLPVIDTESNDGEGEIKLPSVSNSPRIPVSPGADGSSEMLSLSLKHDPVIVARVWNRWLTGVQCIFAPLFMTFIFFRMILSYKVDNSG